MTTAFQSNAFQNDAFQIDVGSNTGGGGGINTGWPQGYKYPYEKWWKKQEAQRLKKLKEASERKIEKLASRVESARDRLDSAKTLEAIARLKQSLENLEIALQKERDHLAELELIEFAMVWDMYKMTLYLQ